VSDDIVTRWASDIDTPKVSTNLDDGVAEILENQASAEALHLAAEVSVFGAEVVTAPLASRAVAEMGLEPLAAAVGHFVRLKRPQPATVGNRLNPGLLGNLNRRGCAVQHLHQLGLLGLAGLFLGDRRLDPLGLGQQFVVRA
jgi:hypothetical protein